MVISLSSEEFINLYQSFYNKAEYLHLEVKGGSMYPFIRSGDWVSIKIYRKEKNDIQKGDIVLFKKDKSLYLHRVLKVIENSFVMKGDMSFGYDGFIYKDDVLGKVISIQRNHCRIDLGTKRNRILSTMIANVSIFLQYPVLLIRKISTFAMIVLSKIQAISFYKYIIKNILRNKVNIRVANEQDQEKIKDFYLMADEDTKENLTKIKNKGFWIIAEINRKIVASLTITCDEKDAELWLIFGLEVKRLFRRLGIGEKILKEAILKAKEKNAKKIGLFVNRKAKPAINLYRKLGFKVMDVFPFGFNCSDKEFYFLYKIDDDSNQKGIENQNILKYLLKKKNKITYTNTLTTDRIDWSFILKESVKEGIFYPLYHSLFSINKKEKIVSDDYYEKFKQTYYQYVSESIYFFHQTKKILDYIESLKIKILLFKGLAIDFFLYDGYLRPRVDLDIVARDNEITSLEKVLFDLGYTIWGNKKDYPIFEYQNSCLFIHKLNKLPPLHIHKHLFNNFFLIADGDFLIDMKKVWKETEPFLDYRYIYILKPEVNIIYLCEHSLKHNFSQLIFLYEIEKLINYYKEKLNWDKLILLSEEFNISRIVYYGLYFVKEVFSVNIPKKVINSLKPTRFTIGEKVFIKNILNKKYHRYSCYPIYIAMRKGILKKINYIFRTVFPKQFTFKGYLMRLFRLILS